MSTSLAQPTGTSGLQFAALVAHFAEVGEVIRARMADPSFDLAGFPVDSLSEFVTTLLAAGESASAAATVLVGQVDAGTGPGTGLLVEGRYASTRRFLEVEGGLSQASASAMVARARDLREDYACLGEPWLTGAVTGDAVREVTTGVRRAVKVSGLPFAERDVARKAALDVVLPVAERGTVADVRRVISHLNLVTNPDGATRSAMDAFTDQSLSVEQVGSMVRLTAYLTKESSAALMTVLTQLVDQRRRAGDLTPEEQVPEGVDPETWDGRRRAAQRYDHLLAVAFGEVFTGLLDDNEVGSHHGIAPHVTLTVDVTRLEAGLGGDLTMPGSDEPLLVPHATVERILCDSDITTVVVRALTTTETADSSHGHAAETGRAAVRCTRSLGDVLLDASREVLYVGRAQRVVPPGCAARWRPGTGTVGSPAVAPTSGAPRPTT
jgi:hypothetical protein